VLENYDGCIFIPGIGTSDMRSTAQTMTTSGKNLRRKIFSVHKKLGALDDTINGYSEREHLVDSEYFFMLVEYLEKYQHLIQAEQVPKEDIELTIGGHSRGAAVGMTSLLYIFSVSARKFEKNENSPWSLVSKIRIIAVDPVPGKQVGDEDTNDMMDLPSDRTIDSIIQEIEDLVFDHKSVFHTTVYTARFDARKEFRLDSRWQRWIDDHKEFIFNHDRAELYIAGFRHSSMVCAEDEITEIYDKNYTPRGLMRKILEVNGSREARERYYQQLSQHEMKTLEDLAQQRPVHKALKNKTKLSSYKGNTFLHGKDLETVVKQESLVNGKYEGRYVYYERKSG
jgi:hypothetical protein